MLLWIIAFLTLGAIAADIIHYRSLRRKSTPARRRALLIFAVVTDLVPMIIALVGTLSRDNDTPFMAFAMWMFWIWMVTVLPRMICYIFRLVRLPRVGIVAAIFLALFFIWGATSGRTRILVNRIEIRSDRIPTGFDGFRIVQFADTHIGTLVRPEAELSRLVDSINSLRPDLIVFCGDLVNIRYTELDDRATRILSGLKATHGVVSVTGNHDIGNYIKDSVELPAEESLSKVIARQREMGWRVLEDTTVYLNHRGDSISLSGISFAPELSHLRHEAELPSSELDATYRGVPDSLYNVTVVHIPQLWPQITAAGHGDLTLSGHVHSMQMKLRLFGRVYSPAQWLYTRWSGRYDEDGRTLYINDGIGYVAYPMRLGAYPEVTSITLRSCE